MRERLFRNVGFLLVGLLLLPVTASAQPSSGCANVDVQTSPAAVMLGYSIGIYGSVNNCASGKKRYTITVSEMSSCGQKTTVASFRMAFGAGENRMYGVSYSPTADICTGTSTVTVSVGDRDSTLTSASTTFTVQ